VYPGATEDDCVPVIERASGLVRNRDFLVGYSPERINPGDPDHRLTAIRKVTSGADAVAAERVDALYASIIAAGTHRVSSIRVAEAAKVIENTQRDVNIALINELAMIFARLGIDTEEVLEAAATKWNFLPFRPGLVGGHCIGVDPYYLTHKAQAIGYHPAMILAGRRVNDGMGAYVATTVVKRMLQRGLVIGGSRVLVMGLAFKENCPDLRNTRVIDIVDELASFGVDVDIWDPWVDASQARKEYGITPIDRPLDGIYDGIVIAVAHRQFAELGIDRIRAYGKANALVFDVKYLLPAGATDGRL
jgi:UDP-N-acetyl-D-galactosamine dehydrogenase